MVSIGIFHKYIVMSVLWVFGSRDPQTASNSLRLTTKCKFRKRQFAGSGSGPIEQTAGYVMQNIQRYSMR